MAVGGPSCRLRRQTIVAERHLDSTASRGDADEYRVRRDRNELLVSVQPDEDRIDARPVFVDGRAAVGGG